MIGLISGNHRLLEDAEIPMAIAELTDAWKSPEIPLRQWVSCVRGEIERYRNGQDYPHFNALVRSIRQTGLERPTVLDVGASCGFYSQILMIAGIDCEYTALDYSEAYEALARKLYPGIRFKLGDARDLPFADSSFEILISGCVLIHVAEYEKVISESARVASKYVVMARTPLHHQKTIFHRKEAYGVPCLEIWYDEEELFRLFSKYGLLVISHEDTHSDPQNNYCQRTYLLKKTT